MSRLLLPALSVLGLAAILHAAGDELPGANPHKSFQRNDLCPRCHVVSGPRIEAGRFSVDADAFCIECHAKEHLGRTHPVGSRPASKDGRRMAVPDEFPLNDDGKTMCLTCHFAHKAQQLSRERSWPAQEPEAGIRGRYFKTFYLRRTDPKVLGISALCDACHKTP